jgi:hypothetical protein
MSGIKLSDDRIIPPDMATEIMSGGVVSVDNISSSNQLLALTTEQIAALINKIDGLISTQITTITSTQQIVYSLQRSIDNPVSGYQVIYDSTMRAYSTSVINYIAQSTLVNSASYRLTELYGSLSSILLEEEYATSTLEGYAMEYSTLLIKVSENNTALMAEIAQYNSFSTSVYSYVSQYDMTFNTLQSTTDPVLISTLSTTMETNLIQKDLFSTFMVSSFYTISTMSFFSTQYYEDLNNYGTDSLYSTLKSSMFSTIEQLWAEQRRITSSITEYDNQIFWLGQSTIVERAKLNGTIEKFYTDKRRQIQNQILQIKYSVQEWESFIGYIISQCMITKLQLYNSIDLLAYQVQQTPGDTTKSALLNQQSLDQIEMQAIIDSLNPLTIDINNIYTTITQELQLRSDFIDIRKRMTFIELDVLTLSSRKDSYTVEYPELKRQLDLKRDSINTSIGIREGKIQTNLMGVFNGQMANIQALNSPPKSYLNLVFVRPDAIYPIRSTNPDTNYVGNSEPPFEMDPTEFQIRGLNPLTFP